MEQPGIFVTLDDRPARSRKRRMRSRSRHQHRGLLCRALSRKKSTFRLVTRTGKHAKALERRFKVQDERDAAIIDVEDRPAGRPDLSADRPERAEPRTHLLITQNRIRDQRRRFPKLARHSRSWRPQTHVGRSTLAPLSLLRPSARERNASYPARRSCRRERRDPNAAAISAQSARTIDGSCERPATRPEGEGRDRPSQGETVARRIARRAGSASSEEARHSRERSCASSSSACAAGKGDRLPSSRREA